MHLVIAVGAEKLVALVDSGSTHNFIDEAVRSDLTLLLHQECCGLRAAGCHGQRRSHHDGSSWTSRRPRRPSSWTTTLFR